MSNAKYIAILMAVFTIISVINFIINRDQEGNSDRICLILIYIVQTGSLIAVYFVSRCKEKFTDILGLTYNSSYAIAVLFISIADLIPYENDAVMNELLFTMLASFFIYGNFFNMRVSIDVFVRVLCQAVVLSARFTGLS